MNQATIKTDSGQGGDDLAIIGKANEAHTTEILAGRMKKRPAHNWARRNLHWKLLHGLPRDTTGSCFCLFRTHLSWIEA